MYKTSFTLNHLLFLSTMPITDSAVSKKAVSMDIQYMQGSVEQLSKNLDNVIAILSDAKTFQSM